MAFAAVRFADLNLSSLPFVVESTSRERLDRAVSAFDSVRSDDGGWQSWSPPSVRAPREVPMAVLTTVVLGSDHSDWVEIDLGAEYDSSTLLSVTCELQVSCWCPTDHNMHVVEQHAWLAGDGPTFAAAFEKATRHATGWLVDHPSPDALRALAGLPERRGPEA